MGRNRRGKRVKVFQQNHFLLDLLHSDIQLHLCQSVTLPFLVTNYKIIRRNKKEEEKAKEKRKNNRKRKQRENEESERETKRKRRKRDTKKEEKRGRMAYS